MWRNRLRWCESCWGFKRVGDFLERVWDARSLSLLRVLVRVGGSKVAKREKLQRMAGVIRVMIIERW